MDYKTLDELKAAGNISEYAGGKIYGWEAVNLLGKSFYFDTKEEAEFYTAGAIGYNVYPVFCDEVKEA